MFIRTILDRNGLNIVTDVSNDKDYVNLTAFEWTEIPDQVVNIGDYYYNDNIIHPNSPEYDSVIAPVVFAGEEEHKKETGMSVPEFEPIHPDSIVVVEQDPIEIPPPDLNAAPQIVTEPLNPGPPLVPDFTNEPLTQENLDRWTEVNNNVSTYLNKLKSNTGVTMVGNKVIFDPPLEYPDGTVQSEFVTIHPDLNDLRSYIQKVDTAQKGLIARIKTTLNI